MFWWFDQELMSEGHEFEVSSGHPGKLLRARGGQDGGMGVRGIWMD